MSLNHSYSKIQRDELFLNFILVIISSNVAIFGYVGRRLLLIYYDLYQKLQLQFYVLLMMGAMDTRNM